MEFEYDYFFNRESKLLDEIITYINSQLPLETRSSILSYFYCIYIPKYKNEYYNFISKIRYGENEYSEIIEAPDSQWYSMKLFDGIVGTMCDFNNDYRYVFLYIPFKLNVLYPDNLHFWPTCPDESIYKNYFKVYKWVTKTNFYDPDILYKL